jgi:hypothetical protein
MNIFLNMFFSLLNVAEIFMRFRNYKNKVPCIRDLMIFSDSLFNSILIIKKEKRYQLKKMLQCD